MDSNLTEAKFLTKGDNNDVHDRGLYAYRQLWLERGQIIGRLVFCVLLLSSLVESRTNLLEKQHNRARFFIPYIGMVTIALNDYWYLKAALIGAMVIQVIWTREV